MKSNLQITFKNTHSADHIISLIEDRFDKLRRKFGQVVSCHVVVDRPHKNKGSADNYHVLIDIVVRGAKLVGHSKNREQGASDLYTGVVEAFGAVESQMAARNNRRPVRKAWDGPTDHELFDPQFHSTADSSADSTSTL